MFPEDFGDDPAHFPPGITPAGEVGEEAPAKDLYRNPRHPYTQALLSAVPEPDPRRKKERILLVGDVPTPIDPPSGCRFHTRCPKAMGRHCSTTDPRAFPISPGHTSHCFLEDPEVVAAAHSAGAP